jgi:hypothetical protein
MRQSVESNFIIEYLRKYKFIFETALAHESGTLGFCLPGKPEGRKSPETVPLTSV